MSEDEHFVKQQDQRYVLETENGRKVPLIQIFEHYEVRSQDADEVASLLGLEETDVKSGIKQWRNSPEVYDSLEERVEDFSASDMIDGAVEFPKDEQRDYFWVDEFSGDEIEETVENPLHAANNAFYWLKEDPETQINEENIDDLPETSYLGGDKAETQVEWTRNGSELGIYAGWNNKVGSDTGFVSYSVDGEQGPVLEVDIAEMEERVEEMYSNAVFGALNS